MFTTNIKDVASVRVSLMILDWSLLEPSNRVARVVCFGELAAPQPSDKNHEMRAVREAAPGIQHRQEDSMANAERCGGHLK